MITPTPNPLHTENLDRDPSGQRNPPGQRPHRQTKTNMGPGTETPEGTGYWAARQEVTSYTDPSPREQTNMSKNTTKQFYHFRLRHSSMTPIKPLS